MKVTCPKCSAEYSVQPDRIPPSGIDMKCSKCLHTFRLSPEQIRSGQQGSPEGLNIQGVTFLGGEQSSPHRSVTDRSPESLAGANQDGGR